MCSIKVAFISYTVVQFSVSIFDFSTMILESVYAHARILADEYLRACVSMWGC